MLRWRRQPPLLARIPRRPGERARPGSLDRAELEAFDTLLGALGDSRAVLVTGEGGKSGVALRLAAAAAAAGRRTVLVECDLARPALASTLGLDAAPGLAEYLRHEAEAPQLLQSAVLAGPGASRAVEPLACIVAGGPASGASSLLASEDFGHAIEKLRGAYDLVLLDGPVLGERALFPVAARADMTIACGAAPEVPRAMRGLVDGLVAAPLAAG